MKNARLIVSLFVLCCAHLSLASSYSIYPVPQKVTLASGTVSYTTDCRIVAESTIEPYVKERIEEVLTRNGLTFTYGAVPSNEQTNILLGINGSKQIADAYGTQLELSRAVFTPGENKFDTYLLQINSAHPRGDILLLGATWQSVFYGLSTLEQILEQATAGKLAAVTYEDYAHCQYRGIVEGCYGHPWSVDDRLRAFEYCKRYKMNVYIYGPKSDPYHLGKWRDDYPTTVTPRDRYFGIITQDDLREIGKKAQQCGVSFVWAIHPAMENGINFSSTATLDSGLDAIMRKFTHLYNIGVRGFGIFIDDLNYTPAGDKQAYLVTQAQNRINAAFNTEEQSNSDRVAPLFFVPTAYALNYGGSNTLSSLKNTPSEVAIAFTGYDCFSNIRPSSCNDMAGRIGRNAVMWWNNPVNDDHDDRIYLRDMTTRWRIEGNTPIASLGGLVLNPMNQAECSKIALFGGADYAWNPKAYNVEQNWEAAVASLFPEDVEMRQAFRTFALNAESLIEPQDQIDLYQRFRTQYTPGTLPPVTDDLTDEMERVNTACRRLKELSTAPREAHRALYTEVRPWLLKVESMTNIILRSLRLLKGEVSLDNWDDYREVSDGFRKLSTDSAFLVSAFEGAGTGTFEKFYPAKPSQAHMEPFVAYIVDKVSSVALSLPWRSNHPQVISNCTVTPVLSIASEASQLHLSGLNTVTLQPGEYVGVNLNLIKRTTLSISPLESNLALEHSINGKEWSAYDIQAPMAYARLRNVAQQPIRLPASTLTLTFPVVSTVSPVASTNMGAYQSYVIGNVTDGNPSTYFWSNAPQAVDKYILLDFTTSAPRYDIALTFNAGDYLSGSADVELSNDNISWERVATLNTSYFSPGVRIFTCNAQGKSARYVRLRITSIQGGNWFQLAEFTVKSDELIPTVTDDAGQPITILDDRSLSAFYSPNKAGFLLCLLTENIAVERLSIFHNPNNIQSLDMPRVSYLADNKWTLLGTLGASRTLFDIPQGIYPTAVKIAWSEGNYPMLYEIYAEGKPYAEPVPPLVSIDSPDDEQIRIYLSDFTLHVSSPQGIESVMVRDITGRLLHEINPKSSTACMAVNNLPAVICVTLRLVDHRVITRIIR